MKAVLMCEDEKHYKECMTYRYIGSAPPSASPIGLGAVSVLVLYNAKEVGPVQAPTTKPDRPSNADFAWKAVVHHLNDDMVSSNNRIVNDMAGESLSCSRVD